MFGARLEEFKNGDVISDVLVPEFVSMLRRSTLLRTEHALLLAAALGVLCLPARAQNLYSATVLEQNGMVSLELDGRQLKPLFTGDEISPNHVIVTGVDGYARFRVADGSTFEVFPNARVVFRQRAGNWRELLNVFLGRVKVWIQHAPGQPNPNDVSTPTAVISVRGTVFDVTVEDDDGTTLVTVDEGVVNVRNLTAPGDPVTLSQGELVRVYRNQPLRAKADTGGAVHKMLNAARDALWQVMIDRNGRTTVPGTVPGSGGGAQGDKGKGGNTPGSPPTPGAPPAPGSPPPPGGD
jgi:hypothetical protein